MIRVARRRFAIGSVALLAAQFADAQPAAKNARVGWIDAGYGQAAGPRSDPLAGFRDGMRERGWVEGRNLTIAFRLGAPAGATTFATELVTNGVDVLFVGGPMFSGVRAGAGQTPIVFSMSGDPVEAKWVQSLARPGGNATGLTSMALELEAKRLELLKEVAPGIVRVGVLGNALHPGYRAQLKASEEGAAALGLKLHVPELRSPDDLDAALDSILRFRAQALHTFQDGLIHRFAVRIAQFAVKHQLVSIGGWMLYVDSGGLMSYGPNERDYYRRVASHVDRILRGTKPADIPVELPTRFELMINKSTAKALGLTLPASMLLRAEQVVE